MKYLENLSLETHSKELSNFRCGGLKLHSRLEVYSTKMSTEDKKYAKKLETKLLSTDSVDDISIKDKKSRKMLIDLIQTLNAAEIDHDFSEISLDAFQIVTVNSAIQDINLHLAEVTMQSPNYLNQLWRDINDALSNQLSSCEAFKIADLSYMIDIDREVIWSFHYFFYNNDLRRVCYFTCYSVNKFRVVDFEEDDDDMDLESDQNSELSNGDDESEDWS
jgi:hypothetical protein